MMDETEIAARAVLIAIFYGADERKEVYAQAKMHSVNRIHLHLRVQEMIRDPRYAITETRLYETQWPARS